MTSRFAPIVWLALALACGSLFAQDAIRWAPDIGSARRASAEFKVPLLIHFYGDNCLPCKTLEQRVLNQPAVIDTLNKYFICVKVNATQDRQTAAEFQVHSWPTDVFVSPDGKTLYQGICQQEQRAYASVLENVKVMNRDRNIMLAAKQPVQAIDGIAQQVAAVGSQAQSPELPRPGANLVTNSQTPNFYGNANNGTPQGGQQQLPPSMPPNQYVQSGPIAANTPNISISGSTPRADQQLQRPAAPAFDANPNGQLPVAMTPPGRLASPANERVAAYQGSSLPQYQATNQMSQGLNVPTNGNSNFQPTLGTSPSPQSSFAATGNGAPYGQAASGTGQVSPGQSLDNPYFQSSAAMQPNSELAARPMLPHTQTPSSEPRFPAQQVSFQPRNNNDVSEHVARDAMPNSAGQSTVNADKPAIDGYCPVALRNSGNWVQGDPTFAVRHRGRVYWLSSEEARAEFLKSPDTQSPVLSGYDPMLFLNEGKLVEGSVQWGLLEQVSGTFLFFSSAELKQQFEQNFEENTRAINTIMKQAGVN